MPEVGNPGADKVIEYIQTILCDQNNIYLNNIEEDKMNDSKEVMLFFNSKECENQDYSSSFNASIIKDG